MPFSANGAWIPPSQNVPNQYMNNSYQIPNQFGGPNSNQFSAQSVNTPKFLNQNPNLANAGINIPLQNLNENIPVNTQSPQINTPQQPQGPKASAEQMVANNSPQSVFNYLHGLNTAPPQTQYSPYNPSLATSNLTMNGISPAMQQNSQGFQGFQGFTGGTQNNLNPYSYGGFNPLAYNPYGGQSQMGGNQLGGGTLGGGTGGMPGQPNYNLVNTYSSGPAWYHQYEQPNVAQLSDQNSKTEIKKGDSELSDFLDSLGIYSYEYKDKKDGEGRRISPMAQEIASTPLGKVAISKDERGYMKVDYGKLMGTMLAGISLVNSKTHDLEDMLNIIKKRMNNKKVKNG